MNYTGNEAMEKLLAPIIADLEHLVVGRNVLEIACGTGNWTQVLSKRARSVVATDVSESALEVARGKAYGPAPVAFELVSAYELSRLARSFDAAFAADWYSHIPKSMIGQFLRDLRDLLSPGAPVTLLDMSWQEWFAKEESRVDDEGNRVSVRDLPDGRKFEVVKNFPGEEELIKTVAPVGRAINYRRYAELQRWLLTCITRPLWRT
jgi:demethylmenaquinone methyltransferase/2-methoxy-6-polyprenyl-1,4-benzoquinol methylase